MAFEQDSHLMKSKEMDTSKLSTDVMADKCNLQGFIHSILGEIKSKCYYFVIQSFIYEIFMVYQS